MTNLIDSLKISQQQTQIAAGNLSVNEPGMTAKRLPVQTKVMGSQQLPVAGKIERANPEYVWFQKSFAACTSYAGEAVLSDAVNSLQQFFDPLKPASLNKVQNNLGSALEKLTKEPNSQANKEQAFQSLKSLVSTIKDISQNISSSADQTRSNIAQNIEAANNLLSKLHNINQQIGQASQPALLYDDRDALIMSLSEIFDVKVSINSRQQALIALKNGGATLVDGASHATLHFEHDYDGSNPGRLFVSTPTIARNEISSGIQGGKIGGLVKFLSQYLPETKANLDKYAATLAQTVNKAFNTGSSYPGKNTYVAQNNFSRNQVLQFSGETKFSVVDKDGMPVKVDGAGNDNNFFRPISFRPENGASLKQVMAQFNQYFCNNPTQNRTTLGNISDIKLNISETGEIGLALMNNSYSDTTVEILGIQIGVAPAVQYPAEATTVKSGEYQLTKHLMGLSCNAGNNITVTIRTVGANGQINQDTLTFNAVQLGQYAGAGAVVVGGANGATIVNQRSNPVARMKLVDKDGREIAADNQAGFLTVESFGQTNVVFGDALDVNAEKPGLAYLLGLNNAIQGSSSETLELDEALTVADFPTSSIAPYANKVQTTANQGTAYAQANIVFDFTAGHQINVGGRFNFLLPRPGGGADILGEQINVIAPINSVNEIVELLKNDNRINSSLDFLAPDGNTLIIRSKVPGLAFNDMEFRINANNDGNGPIISINGTLQMNHNIAAGNLRNGADGPVTQQVDQNTYRVTANNIDAITNLKTLFATPSVLYNQNGELVRSSLQLAESGVTDKYLMLAKNTKDDEESSEALLVDVLRSLQQKTGIDKYDALMQMYQLQSHRTLIAQTLRDLLKTDQEVSRIIMGA
jgi:flagellar hook-associated protein FlgK